MSTRDVFRGLSEEIGDLTRSMRRRPLDSLKIFPKAIIAAHRERRNAKQTNEQLYKNMDFLLIHVSRQVNDNGDTVSLTLVRPAADPSILEDIKKQGGYNCVSHVWGPPEQWQEWNDSGITNTQGNRLSIKIRPEKRDKILRLLHTYGGYWWIDLFCARHDTPLDIMGDIYQHSKVTYALIDCPPDSFTRVTEANVDDIDMFRMQAHRETIISNYLEKLKNLGPIASSDEMTWRQVLDSILGWWYTKDEDKHYFVEAIADIISCSWFTRVWTLQEAVLSKKLHFMLEADDPGCVSFDSEVLFPILETTCRLIRFAQDKLMKQKKSEAHSYVQERLAKHSRKIMGKTLVLVNNHPGSYDKLDELFLKDAHFPLAILYLSIDNRTCLDPCDYVYGVIGYLRVKLPRMNDPKKVWQAFLDEIKPRLPKDAILPRTFDLAKAKDMGSVYSSFQPKRLLGLTDTWKYVHDIYDTPYTT